MKIKKPAVAGTLESSDCLVTVKLNNSNFNEIDLMSTVKKQFGDEIIEVAKKTLNALDVTGVSLEIDDKGALDCVIKARIESAIYRAAEIKEFDWRNYKCQD